MLVKPPIEKLLPKVQNRYALAILVAKRARQLVDGGRELSDSDTPNYVSVASQELDDGKIVSLHGAKDFYVPIRPEIEAARLEKQRESENAAAVDNIKDMFNQLDTGRQKEDNGAAALLLQIEAIGTPEEETKFMPDALLIKDVDESVVEVPVDEPVEASDEVVVEESDT